MQIDIPKVYDEIETLDVPLLTFTTEIGFPYLREKLFETIDKAGKASNLAIKLARAISWHQGEEATQRGLFAVTQMPAHREAADRARTLVKALLEAQSVLKIRRDRLRGLTSEIKLYARVMEDALSIELGAGPLRERKKTSALKLLAAEEPEAPAQHPVSEEDLSELFS